MFVAKHTVLYSYNSEINIFSHLVLSKLNWI